MGEAVRRGGEESLPGQADPVAVGVRDDPDRLPEAAHGDGPSVDPEEGTVVLYREGRYLGPSLGIVDHEVLRRHRRLGVMTYPDPEVGHVDDRPVLRVDPSLAAVIRGLREPPPVFLPLGISSEEAARRRQ